MDSINRGIRYFDLFSYSRTLALKGLADGAQRASFGWQVALYVALVLGIFAKGYLEYLAGKAGAPIPSLARLAVAVIAGIVAFPGAYRSAMDGNNPGLVQLSVTFTTGLGVKTLVDAP